MRASQVWRFFCVVAPGHEAVARAEFEAKRAALGLEACVISEIPGGFEFDAPWELGRGCVHLLKIPTRVLVRLQKIKGRDFPKLYKALRDLPWNSWLQHPTPQLKVTAKECRLMHTGRIEETWRDALHDAQVRSPFSTRWQAQGHPPDLLLLRGHQDEWELSLDLSGEPLYKRGTQHVDAEAPLRETHAAATLLQLFSPAPAVAVTLVDPLCGSGTLLREALGFHLPSVRAFSYVTSPLNKGVAPWKARVALAPLPIKRALGLDLNAQLVQQLQAQRGIEFQVRDALGPALPVEGPTYLVSNPPYGERLELGESLQSFTHKLGQSLSDYGPQRVALVVPRTWPKLEVRGLRAREAHRFSNGGLGVEIRIFS